MQRFIGIVKRITTARHLARIGNEKPKNIMVLENLQEGTNLKNLYVRVEGTADRRI